MRRVVLALVLMAGACEREPKLRPESDQRAISAKSPAVVLSDRSRIVSRRGDAPGETDLFLVSPSGEERPIAAAPGADDMPVAMADGKIAFVSTRSTIASIWIFDPASGRVSQLTNRGLVAGKKREGFVPPPMQSMKAVGAELHYESAPGVWWAVDAASGAARKLEDR